MREEVQGTAYFEVLHECNECVTESTINHKAKAIGPRSQKTEDISVDFFH